MRILTIIKNHLQDQQNDNIIGSWYYTWADQANNILGVVNNNPTAILITPYKWTLDVEASHAREELEIALYYLTPQPELDFNANSNELKIDDMIDRAIDMVARIKNSHNLHIENCKVNILSKYDVCNRNMTGVCLQLKVKEQQGRCISKLEVE